MACLKCCIPLQARYTGNTSGFMEPPRYRLCCSGRADHPRKLHQECQQGKQRSSVSSTVYRISRTQIQQSTARGNLILLCHQVVRKWKEHLHICTAQTCRHLSDTTRLLGAATCYRGYNFWNLVSAGRQVKSMLHEAGCSDKTTFLGTDCQLKPILHESVCPDETALLMQIREARVLQWVQPRAAAVKSLRLRGSLDAKVRQDAIETAFTVSSMPKWGDFTG